MNRVVVDIETVGVPLDELEPPDRWEIDRWASEHARGERVYEELALNAMTGRVVAIGMRNPDSARGRVYLQPETAEATLDTAGDVSIVAGDERQLLEGFWSDVARFHQVITFNGRGFDVPFLVYRSASHRIRPTMGLLGKRYATVPHLDLMDHLSFHGATWPRRSLHFYCRAFGIDSPKDEQVHGAALDELWRAERYDEIAAYCWRDVVATTRLYELWRDFVRPATGWDA